MKVAIVHDDLAQWGGAERVLEGICEIFPDAPIYTSIFDRSNKELSRRFGSKDVRVSFLQKIPGWRSLYKILLPFYPLAFEQFDFIDYDLVISHTTRFAKCIITKPETKHVCYIHTPPRFLWHFSDSRNFGIGEILMNWLRLLDQITSNRVDFYLAGSENAKKRIQKVYRRESQVVYPFVDLDRFKNVKVNDGDLPAGRQGYFVVIGRPNQYKRFDLAKKACKMVGAKLRIISGGLSEDQVIDILAGCKALIIPGIEDFGLTSLEAQALGKPVIAFSEGGVLETVVENETGIFFNEQTAESLANVLKDFNSRSWDQRKIKENVKKFSKVNFTANFRQALAKL